MANSVEQAEKLAHEIEKNLTNRLNESNVDNAELVAELQEFRATCQNIISTDFAYATSHSTERLLWDAHSKVNTHFRKQLGQLRKEGKHRIVEQRKLYKHFLDFIKDSQRFYRQYIRQLDARLEGLPELRRVAQRWNNDTDIEVSEACIPQALQRAALNSCYDALIKLGDLSRYRETESGEKEKDWGAAKGYYELATEINPYGGASYNQQAVIALQEGNHLRSLYHLYRALSVRDPYPPAKHNLELEFKKIVSAWDKGELVGGKGAHGANAATVALVAWFVRLQSKCYKGETFAEHNELEQTILSQLKAQTSNLTFDRSNLHRFVIISLSAEYQASVRVQSNPQSAEACQALFYFVRLNGKLFLTLLQLLQEQSRKIAGDVISTEDASKPKHLSDKVTPIMQRILPSVRLYSLWFAKTWKLLDAGVIEGFQGAQVQELWGTFAKTLSLLTSIFPVGELPPEQYLLEEDVDTVGFQPLLGDETRRLWYEGEQLKQKFSDPSVTRNHPNVEMLMRIRDLFLEGLYLVQNESAPMVLDDSHEFSYRNSESTGDASSPTSLAQKAAPPQQAAPSEIGSKSALPIERVVPNQAAAGPSMATTAVSNDTAMHRMVDSLVEDDDSFDNLPEHDENLPPTPPEQTFEDTARINDSTYGVKPLTAADFVNQLHSYSSPMCQPDTSAHRATASPTLRQFPSLPSVQPNIWSTNYGSPSATSPQYEALPSTPQPRPSTLGHSRGQSASSIRSFQTPNDAWSPAYAVTPPIPPGLGGSRNNSFAQLSSQFQDLSVQNPWGSTITRPAMSMAYGTPNMATANGGYDSPYMQDMRRMSSNGRLSRNGQGSFSNGWGGHSPSGQAG